MPDIVLATLNAKYIHAAFGLRYLLANLCDLRGRAALLEFDIKQRPADVAEALLAQHPKIIGLGVYIWNAAPITQLVATLKRVQPDVTVILGGPEVSYETDDQPVVRLADHTITGEADLTFADVCAQILEGRPPADRVLAAPVPDVSRLALPYDCYTTEDIAHRVIYVEASRGCPFTCEFCLSSLDIPVRQFPLEPFLAQMQRLLDRGVRQFKFVDRTFNLNLHTSRALLEFFLERHRPELSYHFEMIPDRLPEALREVIARFPTASLQFEVGVQSFNDDVCQRIRRRQDLRRLEDNFRFLRDRTGVHVHADLIAGLPGESMESFAAGFDRLVGLGPQEIQVGILKRLRGTPISRHDGEWAMAYHPDAPYELLQNRSIPFAQMQRLKRFARYWDLVANSGNFVHTTPHLWQEADPGPAGSPFAAFMRWSDWLYQRVGRTDSIALSHLIEHLFIYLTTERRHPPGAIAQVMLDDFQRAGRREIPECLRPHLPAALLEPASHPQPRPPDPQPPAGRKRQARHAAPR